MPYIEEKVTAGNTIEIRKYYSIRFHSKGEKRAKKEKPSCEAQKKVNQRKAGRELTRILNTNFCDGDLLVRLDFCRESFPEGSEQIQEKISKALRKLRTLMQKKGKELKYVYVKEVGPRGSRHVHMVMNRCDTEMIRKVWPYGGIHIDPLISNGQYSKIAEYFIKYALRTEITEERLVGKRWYGSRNLEKPKIDKKVISANKFRERIREIEGYYLDKESVQRGISESTGFEYFSYTLIKTERQERGR